LLPRLPSADGDVDGESTSAAETPKARASELPESTTASASVLSSGPTTPKAQAHALPPLPPSTPTRESQLSHKLQGDDASSITNAPPPIAKDEDPVNSLHHLQSLRRSFQRTEQSLYSSLSRTSVSSLNDVRTSFLSAARGATRRLSAWQKKHLKGRLTVGNLSVQEPEWWNKGCHAIPGGNVIIREDDWGSIIAFTLRQV
jgi:1-phosphatidylinositol-3-phosphate 5-kinase